MEGLLGCLRAVLRRVWGPGVDWAVLCIATKKEGSWTCLRAVHRRVWGPGGNLGGSLPGSSFFLEGRQRPWGEVFRRHPYRRPLRESA